MSFDKNQLRHPNLRKEQVFLDAGDFFVWELTVAETAQLLDRSMRPAIDPRGGVDPGEAMIWQIAFSCRESDEAEAPRVFGDLDIGLIYGFRREEFDTLMAAIARVNGTDREETSAYERFTRASAGAATSR